ncbi:helix-turn-helix transcriptional regulator [Olsenella profusa]|uniref:Helix-turn-helix domain-containing protein n=1 Tax=Olsenella profusa TaxID=138595 RepID=A0ABS2F0J1_9ACTN|nr:helix-turn-helix domain-containing protein [Olsenella profusa]MBM6774390.1 helix-turn-helix domain-containing protein [Olsenella profusa]
MSFRDNLQHLRATRNMTQEQLAMLLGVSRQSVTKWEAEHSAFVRAHPFVKDFYTEEDRAAARRSMSRGTVAGIALIFVGVVCLMVLGESRATEREGLCLLLPFIAAGAWPIVHCGMLLGRTNVAEYNRSTAEDLEVEDILGARVSDEVRDALLTQRRSSQQVSAVCGVIMILATIVGLVLLFAPALSAPDPSEFDPAGTSAMWFWVAWPVGAMLCGVVTLLMKAFSGRAD